jgi:hypothetical protein
MSIQIRSFQKKKKKKEEKEKEKQRDTAVPRVHANFKEQFGLYAKKKKKNATCSKSRNKTAAKYSTQPTETGIPSSKCNKPKTACPLQWPNTRSCSALGTCRPLCLSLCSSFCFSRAPVPPQAGYTALRTRQNVGYGCLYLLVMLCLCTCAFLWHLLFRNIYFLVTFPSSYLPPRNICLFITSASWYHLLPCSIYFLVTCGFLITSAS